MDAHGRLFGVDDGAFGRARGDDGTPGAPSLLAQQPCRLEWTINAYNLVFACSLLTGAALGDRFGRRRMLCTGLMIFIGASLLAGLPPTIGVLILARALQGLGAAMMVPLTLTVVTDAFPPERLGWAIGSWSGVGALSGALGLVVGGGVVRGHGIVAAATRGAPGSPSRSP
jgi:MFS family permease